MVSLLHQKLTSRRLSPIYDYLSPRPFHLLNLSLTDILPEAFMPPFSDSGLTKTLPSVRNQHRMPVGYHLVYFPPQVPLSGLLADGTDMSHSPGKPFNQRMWAGGRMTFPLDGGPLLNGQRAVCLEAIRDITVKGHPEEEKVFVHVERRIAAVEEGEDEEGIRIRLWGNHGNGSDSGMITERRDLVFLRDKTPEQAKVDNINSGNDTRSNPEFSRRVIPTRALLFRYSALMFNAHSIHYDRKYTQDIEGYRDLLVPGPLSLTLMLTALRPYLSKLSRVITEVEYRNVAPLYVDEEMEICARGAKNCEPESLVVWIEGKDGRLALRGTMKTEKIEQG
ncbi:hypothetical protein Egran_00097 [Elaphomyces granulatus]|uniref:MaoC-like domain-containing protein n=1 Tax=Elaphomyces granulatus TaxID=519963 RepID=A0A232M714_9EURO|nr:hypothetical protein Egran_00097 [Elaphomyces granulatus]